jgi:hypothetical protein
VALVSGSSSGSSLTSGVIGDILEDITDGNGGGLDGLLGGDSEGGFGDVLGGISDTFSDITGIGASNSEASDVAQMKGENKISASGKKPANNSVFGAASSARERAKEKSGKTGSSGKAKGSGRLSGKQKTGRGL